MILMPYYGVKLDKSFVQKNQMLKNKNTITVRNGGNDIHFFAVPALCGIDNLVTSKDLKDVKGSVNKSLEMLIKQQEQDVAQTLENGEREFFVTVMDY